MISFIVIGRNEEKNLDKCFNSIYDTINFNKIREYEIIYVDSKSTDNSLAIAGEYKEIKKVIITGCANAAVGRNIGANESKGNILYFIDADMQINKEFLLDVIDHDGNMKLNFVSGQVLDIVQDSKTKRRMTQFLGGIFVIQRDIWEKVYGMKTKYKKGQDMDLGLRLFKKGYRLNRIDKVITNHFTLNEMDRTRIWKMLWNKSSFYARSVLYRDHLFNKQMYHLLWKNDKTSILLLFALIGCLIFPSSYLYFLSLYLISIIVRSVKQLRYLPLLECIIYYLVSDSLNIFYFFTFFPKKVKEEFKVLYTN